MIRLACAFALAAAASAAPAKKSLEVKTGEELRSAVAKGESHILITEHLDMTDSAEGLGHRIRDAVHPGASSALQHDYPARMRYYQFQRPAADPIGRTPARWTDAMSASARASSCRTLACLGCSCLRWVGASVAVAAHAGPLHLCAAHTVTQRLPPFMRLHSVRSRAQDRCASHAALPPPAHPLYATAVAKRSAPTHSQIAPMALASRARTQARAPCRATARPRSRTGCARTRCHSRTGSAL